MKYDIVNLKEKTVVGVSTTTSNDDVEMPKKIGGLWYELYQGGVASKITDRVNTYSIGLYSDYSNQGYTVTVGFEVSNSNKGNNQNLTKKVIPAGRYAKFSIHGHMQQAVANAWEEIWKMDLNRSFTGDFEEYINNSIEDADINIYIALN